MVGVLKGIYQRHWMITSYAGVPVTMPWLALTCRGPGFDEPHSTNSESFPLYLEAFFTLSRIDTYNRAQRFLNVGIFQKRPEKEEHEFVTSTQWLVKAKGMQPI